MLCSPSGARSKREKEREKREKGKLVAAGGKRRTLAGVRCAAVCGNVGQGVWTMGEGEGDGDKGRKGVKQRKERKKEGREREKQKKVSFSHLFSPSLF